MSPHIYFSKNAIIERLSLRSHKTSICLYFYIFTYPILCSKELNSWFLLSNISQFLLDIIFGGGQGFTNTCMRCFHNRRKEQPRMSQGTCKFNFTRIKYVFKKVQTQQIKAKRWMIPELKRNYHMKSRINNARGIRRLFPVIARSMEDTDKPLMLSGFWKFVH